jgi:hypothetical protein
MMSGDLMGYAVGLAPGLRSANLSSSPRPVVAWLR